MDRNSIIGFLLIVLILIGFTWWQAPSREQIEATRREQDSLATLQIEAQAREEARRAAEVPAEAAPAAAPASTTDSLATDSLERMRLLARYGIFLPASTGEGRTIVLENEDVQLSISTHGAHPQVIRLKDYTTYHGEPLLLADPDSGVYEWRFFSGNLDISTRDLHFTAEQISPLEVRLKAPTADPARYLAITYRLDSAKYFLHHSVELVGLQGDVDPRSLFFHWEVVGRNNEKYLPAEQQKSTVFYKYFADDRNYLSESEAEAKKLDGRTNWVAFKQDFFSVGLISEEGFTANGSEISITPSTSPDHNKRYSAKLYFDKAAAANVIVPMRLYLGPNHYNTLRRTKVEQFDRIIDLGWGIFGWMNRFLVIPIFNFFGGFNLGYGVIILLLTIAIKLLLTPLTYRNQRSSVRMRALKPEMDAINEKMKDADPLKKQQATMDLYRKAGVNPASGCVPMVIQLPVLYAMFRFFPASIELRQQSFLWADDLSSYDSILDLPFTIPMYGDHVSLFTLLMAASTVIYTLLNQKHMPTQQGMPSMKLMMYMFPVMMLLFMNNFSAGLSYYYLLANLISILQMTVLSRWFIDEEKLRAELLANMKKPRKKSRWQQRLEEMQKQQQGRRR
ncbi:MAG: membrane protein insertase YidC [Flavobacteriales bacterium]|nr:membrane protein insertase YidC [Flavobacteriales bacterium]